MHGLGRKTIYVPTRGGRRSRERGCVEGRKDRGSWGGVEGGSWGCVEGRKENNRGRGGGGYVRGGRSSGGAVEEVFLWGGTRGDRGHVLCVQSFMASMNGLGRKIIL